MSTVRPGQFRWAGDTGYCYVTYMTLLLRDISSNTHTVPHVTLSAAFPDCSYSSRTFSMQNTSPQAHTHTQATRHASLPATFGMYRNKMPSLPRMKPKPPCKHQKELFVSLNLKIFFNTITAQHGSPFNS